MKLAAVIVNYRTPDLTSQVVTALLRELAPFGPHQLYLVDNASGDDSLARFAKESAGWGPAVTVIASPRNGGYGYGINLAVERASALADPPEYLYILNSDAFADPGTVKHLVEALDADLQAGIAGSRIHAPDGATQVAAFRFPSPLGELEQVARTGLLTRLLRSRVIPMPEPQMSCEVDWVSGTSMLVRRKVFEEMGRFDEGFFLYFEETDLCHSARKQGWKVLYVAGAPVTHLGSVSTGMADLGRRMPRYWFESRHRYLVKHHGIAYAALCDSAWVFGTVLWRVKQRLLLRPAADRPRLIRDFLAASARDLARTGLLHTLLP